MKINETIATQMAEHIQPLAAKGLLLPKTAEEIFANAHLWFPKFDASENLIGFFEYREHPDTLLAEMGSVVALKPREGVGKCLLQLFNTIKDVHCATGGFAVTKDPATAYGFFGFETEGDVSTEFPAWFEREKEDRFYIQWR